MKGVFLAENEERLLYTYGNGRYDQICKRLNIHPVIINSSNFRQNKPYLEDVEVVFSTWGMLPLSEEDLDEFFPNLRIVFYAAGSVQYFALNYLKKGIRVCSAWQAMARPVAEFTIAMIILANKAALPAMQMYRTKSMEESNYFTRTVYPGTYNTSVGILGAGAIGGKVIMGLKYLPVNLMVYDPFITKERMQLLGISKTFSLEEIFSSCTTISNHLANKPETEGILDYRLFSLMKRHAAFINTGRGAQVIEADLVLALQEEPLRHAYLDVTYPEPTQEDCLLRQMENIFITPHIAGYAAHEVNELADAMIAEYDRYVKGDNLKSEVTREMLTYMA